MLLAATGSLLFQTLSNTPSPLFLQLLLTYVGSWAVFTLLLWGVCRLQRTDTPDTLRELAGYEAFAMLPDLLLTLCCNVLFLLTGALEWGAWGTFLRALFGPLMTLGTIWTIVWSYTAFTHAGKLHGTRALFFFLGCWLIMRTAIPFLLRAISA